VGANLDLGILGPIEVRTDGAPAPLGGPRQRAVLAVLAINPNQVVSVDRLVDDIWGEHPPATAVHTLHVFASSGCTTPPALPWPPVGPRMR